MEAFLCLDLKHHVTELWHVFEMTKIFLTIKEKFSVSFVYLKRVVLILLVSISIGCKKSNNAGSEARVHHPTSENSNFSKIKTLTEVNRTSREFDELSSRLNVAQFIIEPGKELILGSVSDIEIDEEDQLYLLDSDQLHIFRINTKNGSVDTLSKKGRGPGEILHPTAIEVRNQSLYISDESIGITSINITDRSDTKVLLSDISIMDFAVTDAGIFLKKRNIIPNPNNLLKTFEFYDFNSKTITNEFGDGYVHEHGFPVNSYTLGAIEFVQDENMLIAINRYTPIISGYLDGELTWQRKLNEFKQYEILSFNRGYRIHEKHTHENEERRVPYDYVSTIKHIKNGIMILQVNTLKWGVRDKKDQKLKTFLINSRNGESTQINDMPKIMAITGNKFVAFEQTKDSMYKLYQF